MNGQFPRRSGVGAMLFLLGAVCVALLVGAVANAETGKKALVLASSVSGGASSPEATEAAANGFAVTVVDDTTWAAMTAADFADYQLVVVGDPTCSLLPAVVSQNATALADAVMARAGGNTKAGNRILIGTDPVFHYSAGGNKLTETGIAFAGVQEGATGLYLTFTCGDPDYDGNGKPDGEDKLLPLLTADPTGTWTQNDGPPCGAAASLISNAAQFATLTSGNLQGWFCSVHETFPTFPTDWAALAIATDTPTAPTCGTDVDTGAKQCGEAYVLIAGSGIVSEAPDLKLDPLTDSNPVGTQHTVTATVSNPDASPRSGVLVSFVVTGANAGATGSCSPADCTSGADGKVAFTYTGSAAGDDTINAAITVDGSRQTATASKTWVEGEPGGTGTITIIKSTFHHSSSTAFPFSMTGPESKEFVLDTSTHTAVPSSMTFAELPVGTYTVAEAAPAGWELHRIACTPPHGGATWSDADATATIVLAAGDAVTCTFYNIKKKHH